MILMAGVVKLPPPVTAVIGVSPMAAHNLLDPYIGTLLEGMDGNKLSALWKIGYIGFFAGPVQFGPNGPNLIVLYSLIPWIGVMAAGYAFGRALSFEPV